MSQDEQFLEQLLDKLDQMMESDDSDALFVSGYLRGHITLIAGQLDFDKALTKDTLISKIESALFEARQTGELTPQDSELVKACWDNITLS
ncbi:YfcL family protein [Catenovulum sp. SM1970]|uniref:YfcL family protein n=1 Tax=Marinifaba aquimaris TaxID=2741323 RepID=UPI0015723A2B|nr:YfcL family protein [Marinifaba aquimaris]NTS77972.1 YfcL family protein [Marinifaba aquimaris]